MAAKELAIAVPLIALAVGGFFLWDRKVQPKVDKFYAQNQSGEAAGSILSGGVLVLVDRVTVTRRELAEVAQAESDRQWRDHARTRITVVDAANGSKLLTKVLEAGGACAAASPGRLWCDFDGLGLYEARTMNRVVRADEAFGKANLARLVPKLWRLDGPRAIQLLDDGRVAILDGATLAVTASDQVPKDLRRDPLLGREPTPGEVPALAASTLCNEGLGANLGTTSPPVRSEDFYPPGAKKKRPAAPPVPVGWRVEVGQSDRAHLVSGAKRSADSYLRPTLVGTDDPPFFLHHSSLDAQHDSARLSRLTPTGTTAWTVDLGSPRCEHIERGTTWIVTTQNAQHRAIALDPATGATRWTVAF